MDWSLRERSERKKEIILPKEEKGLNETSRSRNRNTPYTCMIAVARDRERKGEDSIEETGGNVATLYNDPTVWDPLRSQRSFSHSPTVASHWVAATSRSAFGKPYQTLPSRLQHCASEKSVLTTKKSGLIALSTLAQHREQPKEIQSLVDSLPTESPLQECLSRARLLVEIQKNGIQHDWEIEYNEIENIEPLGEGEFGTIYKAMWRMNQVCLKTLGKRKSKQAHDKEESFRNECNILKNLPRHPNIVTFVGLCRNEQTIYLVSEYVSRGDLLGVLHRKQLSMETKVRLSIGIARGMSHLHAQRIIHRDLACRNILVAFNNGKYDAKITDFGLSHKGNYCSNTGFCAIRWMPPEAIHPKTNFFSEKSDVWSFGVLLWELLTNGKEPFGEVEDTCTAGVNICMGKKLEIPTQYAECLIMKPLVNLIHDCWQDDYQTRPTFVELTSRIEEFYTAARNYLQEL